MAVSFGGYFWQSKKIEVRTPLESAASSSKAAPSPPSQDGPELANAPNSNQETLPKLVQIDRGQSDRVVPTPIALTQTNLIPALPAVGQAASVPALEATQDGRLRYKAILSFVNDIKVVAQTDGIILDILVDEGSAVAKDTIMIQIDNRLAVAEREVASKELESAKLKAEDDSQIKFSVASYEVATSVFNRSQELFAKVVEAQEEWEKKRLEKINASNVQLELRTIKAPFTGVVASMQKERYDWVKAGEEILRLVSLDKFRVKGTVRIADSPNTLEGARANVIIPTGTGKVERLEGVVGFVSPESQGSGARNDGTQEYTVWVEIPNKQVGGKYLFRGAMDAIVEITPNP